MVVAEVLVDGSQRVGSRRIWPITEAIRSNTIEARRGRAQAAEKAETLAALLRDRFLTVDPAGGWRDRLDHNGLCVNEFMPASTLYHLLGAIDELNGSADGP